MKEEAKYFVDRSIIAFCYCCCFACRDDCQIVCNGSFITMVDQNVISSPLVLTHKNSKECCFGSYEHHMEYRKQQSYYGIQACRPMKKQAVTVVAFME